MFGELTIYSFCNSSVQPIVSEVDSSIQSLSGSYASNTDSLSTNEIACAMSFESSLNAFLPYRSREDSYLFTPPSTCRISDISPDLSQTTSEPLYPGGYTATSQRLNSVPYPTPFGSPSSRYAVSVNSQLQSSSPRLPITPANHQLSTSWSQLAQSPPHRGLRGASIDSEYNDSFLWEEAHVKQNLHSSPRLHHPNPQRATRALAMQLQNDWSFSSNNNSVIVDDIPGDPRYMADRRYNPLGVISQPMDHSIYGPPLPVLRRTYSGEARNMYTPVHMRRSREAHDNQHDRQRAVSRSRQMHLRRQHRAASETRSSSVRSSDLQSRKRRNSRNSRAPAANKSTGIESNGGVEFMNYTPNDSRQILTGVAPSGSSKTKARREKEAFEKRMRLNQAALRAVQAAGGDIDSFVEQGLLV